MSAENYLNLHVLISHSPSCLNRDDMNMQKSAVFGGVRRVRVSSQSLKRAMRTSAYYRENLGLRSDRTREVGLLADRYAEKLAGRLEPDLVRRTIALVSGKDVDKLKQADAVAPWAVAEIEHVASIVQQAQEEGLDDKKLEKLVRENAASIRAGLDSAVDIALSGRMATSGLMSKVDGAMAIAHAITTHAVDADIDWFTAVDDLVVDEGDVGAGHLNTQEFGSGVFYRYASLNLRQLQENLGGASRDRALEIGAHVAHMLATVVPEAKQQTFAAHNVADLVYVSFAEAPLSLANAFERPIERAQKGGFLENSVAAFSAYLGSVQQMYGLAGPQAVCSLVPTEIEPTCASMTELEEWIRGGGE